MRYVRIYTLTLTAKDTEIDNLGAWTLGVPLSNGAVWEFLSSQ